MDYLKRKDTILSLRKEGITLREIGKVFEISPERVRQIEKDIRRPRIMRPSYCFSCDVFMDDSAHSHGEYKFCNICWKNLFIRKSGSLVDGMDRTREVVRIRDNHTCQKCKKKWIPGRRRFDIHHLNGKCGRYSRSYDNIDSIHALITYCHKCHMSLDEVRKKMINKTGRWKEALLAQ